MREQSPAPLVSQIPLYSPRHPRHTGQSSDKYQHKPVLTGLRRGHLMSLFSIGRRPRPFSEQKGTCQLILRPREWVSAGVTAPKVLFCQDLQALQ